MISRVPLRCALLGAVLTLLLPSITDSAAAEIRSVSVGPIDTDKRAIHFALSGLPPERIGGAKATLKPNRRKFRRVVRRHYLSLIHI